MTPLDTGPAPPVLFHSRSGPSPSGPFAGQAPERAGKPDAPGHAGFIRHPEDHGLAHPP